MRERLPNGLVEESAKRMSEELSDKQIEETIRKSGAAERVTVEDVRGMLAMINADILKMLNFHQDAIDDGAQEIVFEDKDIIVLSDESDQFWNNQFDLMERNGVEFNPEMQRIVTGLYHKIADNHVDRRWGAHPPIVVEKIQQFRSGEKHLLREIARRTDELGSVARAVDSLAVEEFGWSQSSWARLTGRNPSTVSRTTDH